MTSKEALKIFGEPNDEFIRKFMIMWDIPSDINTKIPPLPNVLYCNKYMVQPLENAFRNLIIKNLHTEIKTFDGCFNIRKQRNANVPSKHSWGIAIDFNAHQNPLVIVGNRNKEELRKQYVKWSEDFLNVWRKDFICGADWNTRIDGMHFELKAI